MLNGPTRRISLFLPLFLLSTLAATALVTVSITEGRADVRDSSFSGTTPIALDGDWRWYPGEYHTTLPAGDASSLSLPVSLAPELSQGFGTLILEVELPPERREYGIKIPYMASANRVFVDGQLLGGSGELGDEYRPEYKPLELFFSRAGGTVELAIQVANYHHRRMRLNRVYFGTASQVRGFTHRRLTWESFLFGSLLFLAAYHILVYFLNPRDRAFLFFGGIAVLVALRLGIVGERLLVRLWHGMPPELMMKIGYAPVFLLLPLIILYLQALSPYDTLRKVARLANWLLLGFALLLLLTPVRIYDWVFEYGLWIILTLAVYVLSLLIRRQVFDSRQGTAVILVGGGIILLTAVSDYFRELGVITAPELLSTGIVIFLLLQAYFLAWRFKQAYMSISSLASEVQLLNEDLEGRIAERTRELAVANKRLEELSMTDALTELANRRSFDDSFEREWHRALRSENSLAIVMADIDYFKAYNDAYGHLQGDDCLRRIAEVFHTVGRRSTDVVARYGGEEFVILLPDTDTEGARELAEACRHGVQRLALPHDHSLVADTVTISLGCASTVPSEGEDPEALIERADAALYAAKARGRNLVEVAS